MTKLMEKTMQVGKPRSKSAPRKQPTHTELLVQRVKPLVVKCEMESERQTVAKLLQLSWDEYSELVRVVRNEGRAKFALGVMVYASIRYLEALNNMRIINIYSLFHRDEEIRNDLVKHFSYDGPTSYFKYIKHIRSLENESKGALQFMNIVRSNFRPKYLEF